MLQGRDECVVCLKGARERWLAAGEPVKNAPQDIRAEPNRRYKGVPLQQHGTRTRGTEAAST
jgi:3-mercaptopyruvate sulfurtransferase SseA